MDKNKISRLWHGIISAPLSAFICNDLTRNVMDLNLLIMQWVVYRGRRRYIVSNSWPLVMYVVTTGSWAVYWISIFINPTLTLFYRTLSVRLLSDTLTSQTNNGNWVDSGICMIEVYNVMKYIYLTLIFLQLRKNKRKIIRTNIYSIFFFYYLHLVCI